MGNLSCENLTFNKIQVMPYIPEQCFTVTWPVTHWCTTTVSAWLVGYRSGDQNPWSCNDWGKELFWKPGFLPPKIVTHLATTALLSYSFLPHPFKPQLPYPFKCPNRISPLYFSFTLDLCAKKISTHRNINVPVGVGAPPTWHITTEWLGQCNSKSLFQDLFQILYIAASQSLEWDTSCWVNLSLQVLK